METDKFSSGKFQTAHKIHSGISDSCSSILCCDSAKYQYWKCSYSGAEDSAYSLSERRSSDRVQYYMEDSSSENSDGGTAWWCIISFRLFAADSFFPIQSPDLSFSEFLPERKWSWHLQ